MRWVHPEPRVHTGAGSLVMHEQLASAASIQGEYLLAGMVKGLTLLSLTGCRTWAWPGNSSHSPTPRITPPHLTSTITTSTTKMRSLSLPLATFSSVQNPSFGDHSRIQQTRPYPPQSSVFRLRSTGFQCTDHWSDEDNLIADGTRVCAQRSA